MRQCSSCGGTGSHKSADSRYPITHGKGLLVFLPLGLDAAQTPTRTQSKLCCKRNILVAVTALISPHMLRLAPGSIPLDGSSSSTAPGEPTSAIARLSLRLFLRRIKIPLQCCAQGSLLLLTHFVTAEYNRPLQLLGSRRKKQVL